MNIEEAFKQLSVNGVEEADGLSVKCCQARITSAGNRFVRSMNGVNISFGSVELTSHVNSERLCVSIYDQHLDHLSSLVNTDGYGMSIYRPVIDKVLTTAFDSMIHRTQQDPEQPVGAIKNIVIKTIAKLDQAIMSGHLPQTLQDSLGILVYGQAHFAWYRLFKVASSIMSQYDEKLYSIVKAVSLCRHPAVKRKMLMSVDIPHDLANFFVLLSAIDENLTNFIGDISDVIAQVHICGINVKEVASEAINKYHANKVISA